MEYKKKKFSAAAFAGILIFAGLVYGYVLIPMGFRIPCYFRIITGLKCPGCGITDMCLSVMHGDFAHVFSFNPGLCILAIPAILLFIYERRYHKGKTAGIILIILLLVWGVVRNMVGI